MYLRMRIYLVVAVQLLCELLADPQVRLLASLLTQTLQLVDKSVTSVLEREPRV